MEHIGKQVRVVLKDESRYDGFVHSMDTGTGKLTLHKVTDEDGRRLPGIKHFFNDELHDIYAFENELKPSSKNVTEGLVDKKETGKKLFKTKNVPAHLQRMRDFKPETVLLSNIANTSTEHPVKQDNRSSDYDSSSDPEALEGGTEAPYVLINKVDRKFHDSIDAVLHCSVVGLAMQGVCVGRSGEVCWVQFATGRDVFLFDILELPPECFEEGIKAILENPDVLKVTHDCRLISDYLFHRHNIKLINVFDTQVADVFVDRLFKGGKGGDWPRYVKGLADCALNHLNLEPEQVLNLKTRERLKKHDEEIWATRPISRQLLDALYKNVVHLRPLRQVLIEKMMAEYVAGVDVYLSQVRDSSTKDSKAHQSNLIPMAFEGLRKLMPRLDSYRWGSNRLSAETSNVKGFTDNVLPVQDPKVIISHDSIWHQRPSKGQHMFKQVANQFKFVKKDGTPCRVAEQKFDSTSDGQKLASNPASSSSRSTTSPHISPTKQPAQSSFETNLTQRGGMNASLSSLRGLTDVEKDLEVQKIINQSEEEEVPTGMLIRSVLKQTDPRQLEEREEDSETYEFKPAGVMIFAKKNDKTTTRRQKEVDDLELEMAQYVMENQPMAGSQQEESEYDDWGGTRHRPLVVSQENRDTILKKFLEMAGVEKARRQAELELQGDTLTVPAVHRNSDTKSVPSVHGNSNILQNFAAVRGASSVVSGTVESQTNGQWYLQPYLGRTERPLSDDDQSACGSDTLTQGSTTVSQQLSVRSGHLQQKRCLYRGQISSKARLPETSEESDRNLNISLPSRFESPISHQNHRSVSVPATPANTHEISQQPRNRQEVRGGQPGITDLSRLASILAKTSIRSPSSVGQDPHGVSRSPLSMSSSSRSPNKSDQESSIINRILQDIPASPTSGCSSSTAGVHCSQRNISPASSCRGGITQTSPRKSESVTAALNATDSKIQRIRILAEALKKSEN
uniref:3'-5' exonuclease domain-containing protein n=1 Tax=Magallana gigas TaxID=29159 RepID=A0A8W8KLZ5_MAGGI